MLYRLILTLFFATVWSALAGAQRGASSGDGFSWVEATHPISGERTLVMLPPDSSRSRPGQLAVARRLSGPLRGAAADGSAVVLVQGERVFRLVTGPGPAPGAWAFSPEKGFSPLPSLPELASVDGVVASGSIVTVLGDRGGRLLELDGREWADLTVPEGGFGDRASLLEQSGGLLVVSPGPTGLTVWTRSLSGDDSASWSSEVLFVEGVDPADVFVWKDRLIAVRRAGEAFEIAAVTLDGLAPIARVEDIPEDASWALREESGRVVFVWSEAVESSGGLRPAFADEAGPGWRVVEVSLLTGEELYRGEGGPSLPVTTEDFRRLALLLFFFTVLVLLGALGPRAGDQVAVLPAGVSLAGPGSRAVAWVIDLLPGLLIGLLLLPGSVFTVTATISILHSAISEAAFGKSLGKLAMRLSVVSVGVAIAPETEDEASEAGNAAVVGRSVGIRRPSIWAALSRNGVRFLLPPVAAFGAASRERRHMGDVTSRTAVVVVHAD